MGKTCITLSSLFTQHKRVCVCACVLKIKIIRRTVLALSVQGHAHVHVRVRTHTLMINPSSSNTFFIDMYSFLFILISVQLEHCSDVMWCVVIMISKSNQSKKEDEEKLVNCLCCVFRCRDVRYWCVLKRLNYLWFTFDPFDIFDGPWKISVSLHLVDLKLVLHLWRTFLGLLVLDLNSKEF